MTNAHSIQAIIFDVDDTMTCWRNPYAASLRLVFSTLEQAILQTHPEHTEVTPRLVREAFTQAKLVDLANYEHFDALIQNAAVHLQRHLDFVASEALLHDLNRLYLDTFDAHHHLFDDVVEVLAELTRRNIQLGAYSAATFDKVVHRLRRTGIGSTFKIIAARNAPFINRADLERATALVQDWNSHPLLLDHHECKPCLETPRRITNHLEVDIKNTLFIGDSPADIDPPAKLGAKTLHVTTYSHPTQHTIDFLTALGLYSFRTPEEPHPTISHFSQILEHI